MGNRPFVKSTAATENPALAGASPALEARRKLSPGCWKDRGIEKAAAELPAVARSINIMAGEVTNEAVAKTFALPLGRRFADWG